jgi:phosphoglycolate phosphatase-like HAD superfamily hydrolase
LVTLSNALCEIGVKMQDISKIEAPENVLSFGDSLNDYKAATDASIKHYGCLWASKDGAALKENGCRNFVEKPPQIIEVLKNYDKKHGNID